MEFVEQGHYYINKKGIIIPSVSELVDFHFKGTYKDVPAHILEKAAHYGTQMHELLESYDNGELNLELLHFSQLDPNLKSGLNQYAELKKKHHICPTSQEVIISYQERYAGRYDKLDAQKVLWDVKTTSKKYLDKWACQLGYYYLALGLDKEIGYVIWLPKKAKGEVILIKPWSNEECIKGLEEYEKYHSVEQGMLGVWQS